AGEGTGDGLRGGVLEQDRAAGVGVGVPCREPRPATAARARAGNVWALRCAARARRRGERAARRAVRASCDAELERAAHGDRAGAGLVAVLRVETADRLVALLVRSLQALEPVGLRPGDLRALQRCGDPAAAPGALDAREVVPGDVCHADRD